MAQFSVNGSDYDSKMLPGETQAVIAKRLFAVLTQIGVSAPKIAEALPQQGKQDLETLAAMSDVLLPVAREVSNLADADVTFIMDACLGVTKRRARMGVGWLPVLQNGVMNDQEDSTFAARLGITWHVLRENFQQIAALVGLGAVSEEPAAGHG